MAEELIGNCLVAQSGGPTAVINASVAGVVSEALNHPCIEEIYGGMNGILGILKEELIDLAEESQQNIRGLRHTPGSALGTCRCKLKSEQDYERVLQVFEAHNIRYFFYAGGNDSQDTADKISKLAQKKDYALRVIGVPKTIDNDLGLNEQGEANRWTRPIPDQPETARLTPRAHAAVEPLDLEGIVNYVTPGYATAVFVAAGGVTRVRTTAESHRRVAIIEVMGRHSGYIALGAAYGQPDIILVPESPVDLALVTERVEEVYRHQQNVVIICGEGIVDSEGAEFGARRESTDPSGNLLLSGAAERLKSLLCDNLGDALFRDIGGHSDAATAIFTRKVGHTQRGGRPLMFDRFHASQLGAHAIDLLTSGQNNHVSTIQWSADDGFTLGHHSAEEFRDEWGVIHARRVDPSFYDSSLLQVSAHGSRYLQNIFTDSIGADDADFLRNSLFDSGNLDAPYESINVAIKRRVRELGD